MQTSPSGGKSEPGRLKPGDGGKAMAADHKQVTQMNLTIFPGWFPAGRSLGGKYFCTCDQARIGLRGSRARHYNDGMIKIRFPDVGNERKALGWLPGRFSFKTWATGETLLPEEALPFLAREGIHFQVEGPASYEQALPPLRDSVAAPTH